MFASELLGQVEGVWRDVECLPRADAGIRARRHVAHRVPARSPRGQAGFQQRVEDGEGVLDSDSVDLQGLSRRDVNRLVSIGTCDCGDALCLKVTEDPRGGAHADHIGAAFALLVDAHRSAHAPKRILGGLACHERGDSLAEPQDLRREAIGHAVGLLCHCGSSVHLYYIS